MHPNDLQLLTVYANTGEEAAFTELVKRHTGWMLATARRRLHDHHLADDAIQAAFVLLASKSLELIQGEPRSIAAWLFRVLHFGCAQISRARARRHKNESQAAALISDAQPIDDGEDSRLRFLLEDTVAQLSEMDREALVLRFYQQAEWAMVGTTLGISAEAARKRVSRALSVVKELMLRDGIDTVPDHLLPFNERSVVEEQFIRQAIRDKARIDVIAKGTQAMIEQSEAIDFTVMTAEFFVRDVEATLDFFEKLGFRRRWSETPDAMGRVPRASLAGGAARIWLRQATETEGTRPMPGVGIFFWINGGVEGLTAHRNAIAAQGVEVSPFFDDHTLRNFTVTSPDGYSIGFFTSYK